MHKTSVRSLLPIRVMNNYYSYATTEYLIKAGTKKIYVVFGMFLLIFVNILIRLSTIVVFFQNKIIDQWGHLIDNI